MAQAIMYTKTYVGVWIDEKLPIQEHIYEIANKL